MHTHNITQGLQHVQHTVLIGTIFKITNGLVKYVILSRPIPIIPPPLQLASLSSRREIVFFVTVFFSVSLGLAVM